MTSPAELSVNEAERPHRPNNARAAKVGWRVKEWREAVGLGLTKTHELIRDGRIESVMLDGARIIRTSPEDFLNSL
jgi:hypothetical protein